MASNQVVGGSNPSGRAFRSITCPRACGNSVGPATKMLPLAARSTLATFSPDLFELLRDRVGVLIERERRRMMAREGLCDLGIHATRNERGHVEVAQHVKGPLDRDPLRVLIVRPRFREEGLPDAVLPVVIVDRPVTRRSREDKGPGRAQPMQPQLLDKLLCERDPPAAIHRLEIGPSPMSELLGHPQSGGFKVDLGPFKARELPEPQARACGGADEKGGRLIRFLRQ